MNQQQAKAVETQSMAATKLDAESIKWMRTLGDIRFALEVLDARDLQVTAEYIFRLSGGPIPSPEKYSGDDLRKLLTGRAEALHEKHSDALMVVWELLDAVTRARATAHP